MTKNVRFLLLLERVNDLIPAKEWQVCEHRIKIDFAIICQEINFKSIMLKPVVKI